MIKLLPALAFVALAAPALAQATPAPAEKVAYTCYYSASGKLTTAKPAEGTPVPRYFVTTGRGGDQAWAYGIKSVDGHECPARVRN
jgi:hypothetical protein